jgi:hypothetical protein
MWLKKGRSCLPEHCPQGSKQLSVFLNSALVRQAARRFVRRPGWAECQRVAHAASNKTRVCRPAAGTAVAESSLQVSADRGVDNGWSDRRVDAVTAVELCCEACGLRRPKEKEKARCMYCCGLFSYTGNDVAPPHGTLFHQPLHSDGKVHTSV